MIPDFGDHAAFVWTAYGVTFAALAGMVAIAIFGYLRAAQRLRKLERQVDAYDTPPKEAGK